MSSAPLASALPQPLRLLVAIPCLDEAATIAGVIRDIPRQPPGIGEVEVLVVDDGSSDDSTTVARAAGATVLSHGRNLGLGVAFRTATEYALAHGYDVMVQLDADGQFDARDIPAVIAPIVDRSCDMVTASRFADPALVPAMPLIKRWGNHAMSALISRLCGQRFHDVSCGFRAYSREALLHLNLHGRFTYTQETFLDLTFKRLRITEVPVKVRYADDRRSRVAHSILHYAFHAAFIIFRCYRDYYPLRVFAALGIILMTFAAGFGGIFGWHFFTTGRFSGYLWAGFLGGATGLAGLFFLGAGMFADMLDRIRVNQERIIYMLKKNGPR